MLLARIVQPVTGQQAKNQVWCLGAELNLALNGFWPLVRFHYVIVNACEEDGFELAKISIHHY